MNVHSKPSLQILPRTPAALASSAHKLRACERPPVAQASFDALPGWLEEVRSKCTSDVVCVLVGNKVDAEASREVDPELAHAWAAENGMAVVEVSAKEGVRVQARVHTPAKPPLPPPPATA